MGVLDRCAGKKNHHVLRILSLEQSEITPGIPVNTKSTNSIIYIRN